VAASTITGVVIKLPAGALSDVLGRKRMMLLGCLFFAAPPFLYPFVYSASALLALRFLHGFATAIFSPVASAYVADLSEQGRGEKLGWFAAAGDLGSTVGPLLSGLILFYTASYTTIYLIVGGLGLGVAIVTPSTTALVADLVVAGRMGSAMGVFGTIWDTGEAAGPILAGFLIASLSYAPAFTFIAALMAVVALIFAIFVRDPHTAYEQV